MGKTYYPRPKRRVRHDAPLSHNFGVRVAEDEAEAIRAAAEAAGVSVAQWLRGTAVSASAAYLESAPFTGGAATPSTVSADALDQM